MDDDSSVMKDTEIVSRDNNTNSSHSPDVEFSPIQIKVCHKFYVFSYK